MTVEENLDMGGYTQPASTIGPNKEKVFELFPAPERAPEAAGRYACPAASSRCWPWAAP